MRAAKSHLIAIEGKKEIHWQVFVLPLTISVFHAPTPLFLLPAFFFFAVLHKKDLLVRDRQKFHLSVFSYFYLGDFKDRILMEAWGYKFLTFITHVKQLSLVTLIIHFINYSSHKI